MLKNALDFLHAEWADKAVGFAGDGGIGAGTRAIQQLKQVVTTLRMVPVFEAVNIPFAAQALDDQGRVLPDENRNLAAVAMLDELARLTAKLLSGPPGRAGELQSQYRVMHGLAGRSQRGQWGRRAGGSLRQAGSPGPGDQLRDKPCRQDELNGDGAEADPTVARGHWPAGATGRFLIW